MAKAIFDAEFILSCYQASKDNLEACRERAHEKGILCNMGLTSYGLPWARKTKLRTREEAEDKYDLFERISTDVWFDQRKKRLADIMYTCKQVLEASAHSDGLVMLDDKELDLLVLTKPSELVISD